MTKQAEMTNDSALGPPILFIVDADEVGRLALESALVRRFAPDFRVLSADSVGAGLETLERLARQGDEVALVAADLRLPGMDGVEFLERARAMHPGASRALLVAMDVHGTRLPVSALGALRRATALGRIDFSILKGWVSPEEWLYPQVQEALAAWTKANRPHHETVRVVGERQSARSHELRDGLTRNTVPFGFYPSDSDVGRRLLREHGAESARLPVVILYDGRVLADPSFIEVAEALGVRTRPTPGIYDLAIIGAGPAGLAGAVYGASEGLRTLIVESQALGGQAGASSMIRNYLGFPRGLSGGELTSRAYEQAMLFGAEFVFMQRVTGLTTRDGEHVLSLSDAGEATARAIIIAAGVTYRRLGIPALDRLIGAGVFYGAASVEAPALSGEEVYVVGGANSAGQAALHLASYAASVTLLARGESLAASMSDYLITQLESTANVHIGLRTRVVDGGGDNHLETLILEDLVTGKRDEVVAAAVFVLIGAEPHTAWLADLIQRDERGFILTGRDIPQDLWPLERPPLPFETSLPGVFAVGDVRFGSVKRVAGAVGEGSVAVGSVHQYLADLVQKF